MPFDASRWPDPATIAHLIERRLPLQAHCNKCGRSANFDPTTLPLAPETIVPALEGRFRCTRCGSRETSSDLTTEWKGSAFELGPPEVLYLGLAVRLARNASVDFC